MTDTDRRDLLQALNSVAHTLNASLLANGTAGGNRALDGGMGSNATSTGANFSTAVNNVSLLLPPAPPGSAGNATLVEEYHYWMLVMLLVPALTIFGNVLVVLAVCRERSLQSATNYFIVSLASADILVASIVMPVSVVVEVRNGHWDFSNLLCDLWIMCDALFSTASILNLVAISIDRFIAVTQPIKYSKHKDSKRTHFTIAGTWLLSVGIALPIGCGLQNMQGLRYRDEFRHVCTFFNGDFLIYSSLGSFYIPCMVMLVLYYRIFTVIRSRAKKACSARKLQNFANSQQSTGQCQQNNRLVKQLGNHAKRPQSLATVATVTGTGFGGVATQDCAACRSSGSNSAAAETAGVYLGDNNDDNDTDATADVDGSAPVHTCQRSASATVVMVESPLRRQAGTMADLQSQDGQAAAGPSNSNSNNSDGAGGAGGGQRSKKQQLLKQLKLRKKTPGGKAERSAARREKKATKTLAIVLGVFLFCWVPFFITNLMWAACLKNFDDQASLGPICDYDRRINVFIVWLGYVNSFLNPLIYTIFNTEFRKAFKKLLHIA